MMSMGGCDNLTKSITSLNLSWHEMDVATMFFGTK